MVDIKAVADDGNEASTIDDAIDTLMQTEIDVTDWDTVWQRRTVGIEYQEDVDGKTFCMTAGDTISSWRSTRRPEPWQERIGIPG